MHYWEARKDLKYYKKIKQYLEECGPCDSVCDVGCAGTPVAAYGSFKKRTRLDINALPDLEGVTTVKSDWLDYQVRTKFSVIVCSQVLEHLHTEEVQPFVNKLFSSAEKAVVISVPYCWKKGLCAGHHQDPINLMKFVVLTGHRTPDKISIVQDVRSKRLVALFEIRNSVTQ